MGDENDADAATLEFAHDPEQPLRLALRQSRGGLIHDDQPRLHRQRTRDLDHLLLGDGQIADELVRRQIEAEPAAEFLGRTARGGPIDERPRHRLAAQEDVLRHRQRRKQAEFLVDRDDAKSLGGVGRGQGDLAALEDDGTGVRLLGAR